MSKAPTSGLRRVLYEMLTGRAVFAGGVSRLMAGVVVLILRTALRIDKREIRMVLRNCLHKDQRKRWQDASSLRIAAVDAVEASPDPAVGAHHRRPHANRRLMLVAGLTGLIGAAVSGVAVWSLRPDATPLPNTRLLDGIALPRSTHRTCGDSPPAPPFACRRTDRLCRRITRWPTRIIFVSLDRLEAGADRRQGRRQPLLLSHGRG